VEGAFCHGRALPEHSCSLADWVGAIKNPKTSTVTFTQEEKDILLGKAAEQVWDLSPMRGLCRKTPSRMNTAGKKTESGM